MPPLRLHCLEGKKEEQTFDFFKDFRLKLSVKADRHKAISSMLLIFLRSWVGGLFPGNLSN